MKMNQQTAIDIFGTWQTVTLVTVGATIDLVWGLGFGSIGVPFLFGLASIGAGVAYGVQRFFTEGEAIQQKQIERVNQQKREKEESRLAALAAAISKDADDGWGKRTREVLRDLRAIKTAFESHINDPEITNFVDHAFQATFLELFWKAIRELEKASKLLATAKTMTNNETILKKRHAIIEGVEEDLVSLTESFEGLTTLAMTHDEAERGNLNAELQAKLDIRQAMARELDGGGYDVTLDRDMRGYLE